MNINNLFDVSGKVVIVTGGSRGIGEMITAGYLANGAKVYITARKEAPLILKAKELSEQYNAECIALPCDLSTISGINNFYDQEKDLINRPRRSKLDQMLRQQTKLSGYFILNFLAVLSASAVSFEVALFFSGFIQSLAMISLVVTLLAVASEKFRGLVMGVRMIAVYGLPLGLMFSGYLIEYLGYGWSVMLYGAIGLILSALVTFKWRNNILVER